MRDGVRLYTTIFAPVDRSHPYPIMLSRTPYSVPYGPSDDPRPPAPSQRMADSGYIFVLQDVRGKFMSEGAYVNMRPENAAAGKSRIDESTDTYDTIDWLVRHVPNNNGRVGTWGISYPGFYASCGLINSHPALKAVSPQAPIADWFAGDDDHHNGAFLLLDNFDWEFSTGFDAPRSGPTRRWAAPVGKLTSSDAYTFYLGLGALRNANGRYLHHAIPFWDELIEHGTYDSFWQQRDLLPHLTGVKPVVLVVGGWYDAEDYYGTIKTHETLAHTSPSASVALVLGPWPHGGWEKEAGDHFGDFAFGSQTGAYFRDNLEFPFFEKYLKGSPGDAPPAATVYDTGANRWLALSSWPPRGLTGRSLFLGPNRTLAPTAPAANTGAEDSYVCDPADPVPYTAAVQLARNNNYLIEDQRFAGRRPDVLSYETPPLTGEATVMGPITVDVFVSTTGTDSDYIVKLIDVYPDDAGSREPNRRNVRTGGYERLVRADVMRGKFRNSLAHPEPFVPGRPTEVRFDLLDVCHTFQKGHRFMVQIQSSWFPLVDRNPNKFMDIAQATDADFTSATERVYRSAKYPSHITFGAR
jgi:putative CocE/NonD family hydrolase